jgi:hypothetical protein
MKKVLLASDCTKFSEGAFEFARRMNESEKILLTGAFLPQIVFSTLWNYASGEHGSLLMPLPEGEDKEAAERNIAHFEILCRKYDIDYTVHRQFFDFALPEFKTETRFADLVILSSEIFYGTHGTVESGDYLKNALHEAECPVVIVPEKFSYPQSNILAYDGSPSSVFAIKQFAYLFPELCDNKTWLVKVGHDDTEGLPHEENIEELAGRHFSYINLLKLDLDPDQYFSTWIEVAKAKPILVAGSFGRSFLSRLLKKSFVNDVIAQNKYPIFISHR